MNKVLKVIGRNIAHARKAKGWTQDELAHRTGMDRSYLSEIENGHKNPSVLVLLDLANTLDVSPSQLLET
ncbi:MAG TPA: helix-turn-helix transcriptional regulator [Alphaproteobacteria bacterium]|nr:helix-turn-helix transcriptional regulator [Alphaproteobacteria bacterium]